MDAAECVEDCAICLQKCHHPTKLPCGHIFCFLCVKGVTIQSRKCAMCRADIPSDYLEHPNLLQELRQSNSCNNENVQGNQWYYEGTNGWWKYDERSNDELERSFLAGETECTLLLAGSLYIINYANMLQMRSNNHSRRRRVKRDTPLLPAKGIAGIKNETKCESCSSSKTDNTIIIDSSNVQVDDNPSLNLSDIDRELSSLQINSSELQEDT